MSTTTFSGPVKAGNIFNTTGTTLSDNVANQGQATMVQVAAVSQAATAQPDWTDIVIPANSQITRMALLITTAGTVTNIHIGRYDSVGTTYNWFADTVATTAIGLKEVVGADVSTPTDRWKDIGAIDCHISYLWQDSGGTETGKAILIVEYIQNNNLTA